MSCECGNIICLEVFFNPCSEGAELNIFAQETGDLSAIIEFNGMPTQFSFGAVEGEKIIIPSEFLNENYIHEFKLYDSAGELLQCYNLKSRALMNAGDFTPITPSGMFGPIEVIIIEAGPSFTDARLAGKEVAYITTDDQSYTSTKWTKLLASDTLNSKLDEDNNPYLSFYVGQIIIVNFLNE